MRVFQYLSLVLVLFAGIVLAQSVNPQITDSVTSSNSLTPFQSYCHEQCFELTDDERCSQLCYSDDSSLSSFCNEVCVSNGQSEVVCGLGCNLVLEKRTTMASCFDSCAQTKSSAECDSQCGITSTVKTIANVIGMAIKENITDISLISDLVQTSLEQPFTSVSIMELDDVQISDNATAKSQNGSSLEVDRSRSMTTSRSGALETIEIPVMLSENEQLESFNDNNIIVEGNSMRMRLSDGFGDAEAELKVNTTGFIGTGDSAKAEVTDIHLTVSEIKSAVVRNSNDPFKPSEVNQQETKLTLDIELNTLPKNASISVNKANISQSDALNMLKTLNNTLNSYDNEIAGVGALMSVDKTNLDNQDEIKNARLTFQISKSWVDSNGGIENVRVLRQDGSVNEILDADLVETAGNYYSFGAFSSKGLSLYAVVTVGVVSPVGDDATTASIASGGINVILIGAVLLIVAAAIYFIVLKRK